MKPSLQQMQATFWQHMLEGRAAVPAEAMFYAENGFSASDRMAIHADMYAARLLEAIRADFDIVRLFLGDAQFETQALAYLQQHPSQHFSIAHAGARFPAFLARAGLHAAADLAALCRARMEAIDGADCDAIDMACLSAHPAPEHARLTLVPALHVLAVGHDVTQIWRALQTVSEGSAAPATTVAAGPSGPTAVAVWRADDAVLHTTVDGAEAQALALAREGAPLAAICEAFAGAPDPEAEAMRVIGAWFADGWVASVR